MGRGSSGASRGASRLSTAEKQRITNGIASHTESQNDSAMRYYEKRIEREQRVIDNYDGYIRSGYIKGKSDPWWVDHEKSLESLKAQYDFFQKERKRLGR